MDITLAMGLVSCVIGVSTFVSGMIARSKNDGQTVEKINQCIKGIEEIKQDLKEQSISYSNLNNKVIEHDGRLKSIEDDIKEIFERLNRS